MVVKKKKLQTFSRLTTVKLKTLDVEPIHPTMKFQMLKKHQGARYHPTTWLVLKQPIHILLKLAVASLKYAKDSNPQIPRCLIHFYNQKGRLFT
jgi:hypothetical protein